MNTTQVLYRLPKWTLKFLMVYLFLEIIDLNCTTGFGPTLSHNMQPEKKKVFIVYRCILRHNVYNPVLYPGNCKHMS